MTVPSIQERNELGGYAGLEVLTLDDGKRWRHDGTSWRPLNERWQVGATGNSLQNAAWQGTTYGWVSGLGAKQTIPADGTVRRLVGTAGANIAGAGWLRLRVDRAGGTTTYYPNATGLLNDAPQARLTFDADFTLDGTQVGTVYLEARASVAGAPSFYVPDVSLTAN